MAALDFPSSPLNGDTYTPSGSSTTWVYSTAIGGWYQSTASNFTVQGSLGVGTNASGVTGEIRASNNVTAYYSSDIRLKENIEPINNPIDKISSIRGVEFDWTDSYIKQHGGEDGYFVRKHDVGVIAQEVESILPEVVGTRGDGIKAVRYDKLIALLIEAVKDQQEQINNLKTSKKKK